MDLIERGACGVEEFPVWADGSQGYVRCELPRGHSERHRGHLTDDGVEEFPEWTF